MLVNEFAKYVIDNIGRASIVNSLNITSNLDGSKNAKYNIVEFIDSVEVYVGELLSSSKINNIVAYKILVASSDCRAKCCSDIKYNKVMLIDDYIVKIWEAVNGSKTS